MCVVRNDHDRWFKELITTFFEEFILAFFPDVYEHLDFTHVTFLQQEVFTDIIKGSKGTVDLLVETKLKGEDALIVVHIESQSSYEKEFNDRMFIYFSRLYEKYRRPIVPIAVFSYDKYKEEVDNLTITFPFKEVLSFYYYTLQLKRQNWRKFLNKPNPAALALLGKMGYDDHEKAMIKLEFLRVLVTLELNPARIHLVNGIFEKYLSLNKQEEVEFNESLKYIPKDEVDRIMELMTSWEKKGYEKGIGKGIEKGITKVAKQMIAKGLNDKDICELTGLTLENIEKLKQEIK